MNNNAKEIWDFLYEHLENPYGVAGLMGNLYAESALNPINLQNAYEKKLGMTNEEYTAAVDKNTYVDFVHDSAGYGLAQWTYWSRKENLLNYVQQKKASIGDLTAQLEFLVKELQGYKDVYAVLKAAKSVREASDVVVTKYERPANQSEAVKAKRCSYGQKYFDQYVTVKNEAPKEASQSSPAPTKPVVSGKSLTITGGSVNIRTGAGTNYSVYKVSHKGDVFTKADIDGWMCIKYGGKLRWISSKYVSTAGECTGGSVNVRSGPGTKFPSVAIARRGEHLNVIETDGWVPIVIDNAIYWVSGKYAK